MSSHELQTDEDVEQILRIAVTDSHSASDLRERLSLAANELGLSEQQVRQAEAKWILEKKTRQEVDEYIAQNKLGFWIHLPIYLAVNIPLVILNISEWEGFPWSLIVLVSWGVGLFAHWQTSFNAKSPQFRDAFAKWKAERESESLPSS